MRNVVLYTLTSLDGAVDDPRRYFPDTDASVPGAPVFDPVAVKLETQMIRGQDAVLLGRRMYDEWSGYWPTSDEQPFADFINNVKKYVVTSTPLATGWGNAGHDDGRAQRSQLQPGVRRACSIQSSSSGRFAPSTVVILT